MSCPTGIYALAADALKEKGSGITAEWLERMFSMPKRQAYNCILYLARKHVLAREQRGSYRYHSAA